MLVVNVRAESQVTLLTAKNADWIFGLKRLMTTASRRAVVEESCAKRVGYLEQIDTFIFFSEFCLVGYVHVSYKTRP